MGGCGGIRIQANGLENYVRDLICGMLADPVTRAAMAELTPVAAPGTMSDALADLHLRRERLIDLYTEGDIDRATFRTRQAKLDDQIRATEAERSGNAAAMPAIPSSFDELVTTWEESGIDFQRRLVEILVVTLTVRPATSRRRAFDPTRVGVKLRA
jgi:hypothetical protein